MKFTFYTKEDRWIIGILLPPVVILVNFWMLGKAYFSNLTPFLFVTLISVIVGLLSWLIQITLQFRCSGGTPAIIKPLSELLLR